MRYNSIVKLLIGSLVLSMGAISCAAPNSSPAEGTNPSVITSQEASNKPPNPTPKYIEATPVPSSNPSSATAETLVQFNSNPELQPGEPAPEVEASLIKNAYDENGNSSSVSGKMTKPPSGETGSKPPQTPRAGIPIPPKPGVPTAPSPVKPSDPEAVVPSSPAPVKPQEPQAVVPSNPRPVQPGSAVVKVNPQNQTNKKGKNNQAAQSTAKVNIKNLPTK
ncbi:MAG: hypothetical protein ACI376_06145 [Candidatus Bruticola sp.]